MSTLEYVRLALSRLRTGRVRAALTMLGVIIGTASVVALVSVGQGTGASVTSRIESLGTNLLTVTPGAATTGFTRGAAGSATTLSLDDAAALQTIPTIAAAAPELTSQRLVVAGTRNTTTTVVGTTTDYTSVLKYELWQGSFLTDASVERSLRVAVLGSTTADDLGLGAADLGRQITIAGIPFQVIGILQPKGGVGFASPDDQVVVPLGTAHKYFVGGTSVRAVALSVADGESIDTAKAQITELLRERHGLAAAQADDFTIQDQSQLLATFASIGTTLTLLLAGIASISLIVGGIGIMNIMLVSVRERTREIGIRKAVGARSRDVLAQFLIEALTLSVIGGLAGIALGVAVSALIGAIAGWGLALSPALPVVALGFSVLVGIVFGVWPARQAALLDPIVALRYE
jgi:putative ABC transport system permease protein